MGKKKDYRPIAFFIAFLAIILGAYMITLSDWGDASINWTTHGQNIIGGMSFIAMIGFCFYGLTNVRKQRRGSSRTFGTIMIFFFLGILWVLFIGFLGGLLYAEAQDIADAQIVVFVFSILFGVILGFVD